MTVTAIGRFVTGVATKFGLCSRKAAMRFATETGKKLVDESEKLGRSLNPEEIENAFAQVIPKKIRPKLLTSKEEAAKQMLSRNCTKETVDDFLENPDVAGVALTVGRKKAPIYVKELDEAMEEQMSILPGFKSSVFNASMIAHEVEHALEYNGRFSKILSRKIFAPLVLFFKKDKKAFLKKLNSDNLKFQCGLQEGATQELLESGSIQTDTIKNIIKNILQTTNQKIRFLRKVLNLETPAYIVGSNVEKYGYKDPEAFKMQDIVATIYQKAQKVLKEM